MTFTETFHTIPVPEGEVGARQLLPADPDAATATPLIVLHGGPGSTHDAIAHYLAPLAEERPVVFYDQLGSARSPSPLTPSLMEVPRFVAELAAVQDYFNYPSTAILGHSWGGSVVLDFALAHPGRTAALILSSPLISTSRWIADANKLLAALPAEARDLIRRHEAGEHVEKEAYDAAEKQFYNRHVCRLDPWPQVILDSFLKGNKELYNAMWGASEFVCTGTLKTYERWDDLAQLRMPTLICCGQYDEATPETMRAAAKKIAGARVNVIGECSHVAWAEDPEMYMACVSGFLEDLEAPETV